MKQLLLGVQRKNHSLFLLPYYQSLLITEVEALLVLWVTAGSQHTAMSWLKVWDTDFGSAPQQRYSFRNSDRLSRAEKKKPVTHDNPNTTPWHLTCELTHKTREKSRKLSEILSRQPNYFKFSPDNKKTPINLYSDRLFLGVFVNGLGNYN